MYLKVNTSIDGDSCHLSRKKWNFLSFSSLPSIKNKGVCTTFEWAHTLKYVHDKHDDTTILLQHDNDNVLCGVLPLFKAEKRRFLQGNAMHQYSELYATRSGLLFDRAKSNFASLMSQYRNWSQIKLTVIADSEDERDLIEAIKCLPLWHTSFKLIETPYHSLNSSFEDMLASLDKSFKKILMKRIRKLGDIGEVKLKVFESEEQATEFLNIVFNIERNSWKEAAGTSITTNPIQKSFFEKFTPLAARNGWLRGFVLFAGEKPIGYSYGILFNHVLESLKTSFSDEYKSFGPGHIIYLKTIEYLYKNNVKYFDFLGIEEAAKEKWTTDTYFQNTYIIYNKNFYGLMAYSSEKVKKMIKKLIRNHE